VCDCGNALAGQLDTEALRRQAASLPGVVYAARDAYPCSKDGQARLRQAIAEHGLERVLIAGCAPRLVEKLFREAGQTAGLEGNWLEVTDIREQCTYVHANDGEAMHKAASLIEMGVARLAAAYPSPSRAHVAQERVVRSAMVIGSGLGGLTTALALANAGFSLILIEPSGVLGGETLDRDERARSLLAERIESAKRHPRVRILLNARVTDVSGRPGNYEAHVTHANQTTTFAIGAIIVAAGARPRSLGTGHWYDRSRVVTQAEFETELETGSTALQDVVMILCAEEASGGRCSRVCCLAGIRQASRVKRINPSANVTILFRDLYLGGTGDLYAGELQAARQLGVTFFRYQNDHKPVIGDKTVDVHDTLTGETLRIPFERVVLSTPLEPEDYLRTLAALLRVPQDDSGFLVEPRVRLRPGRYTDDGVYVLGGAHQPVDTTEALFQAYLTSSRVERFLSQEAIHLETSVASVDAGVCTGCGLCVPVCPTMAIALVANDSHQWHVLSLAEVEPLRCIGCGNCMVACPVKAITLPGWEDAAILAQISAAFKPREGAAFSPARVLAFACEWSAYAAADMAGVRRLNYPAGVRIIRMPCSARFDPNHILWAFINGANGVFLGACPPGECHYGLGNLFAQERVEALKKQMAERGIDPRRLCLEFLPGDNGEKFVQAITAFAKTVE
jgi:heterodisulfide reductase subunit A